MSTTYVAAQVRLRTRAIGRQREALDAALAELAETDPESAERLRALDWAPILRQVCGEALAQAATELGYACRDAFAVSPRVEVRNRPTGECVGVLYRSMTEQVGLVLDGTDVRLFHEESASGPAVDAMCTALERAHNERAWVAALRLLGGTTVTRESTPQGAAILETDIEQQEVA